MRRWAGDTRDVKVWSSSRVCTPSPPSRSISPCSTSTVARASASARWLGVVEELKAFAREDSLQLGASSLVMTRRASLAVSRTSNGGQPRPWSRAKWRRNPTSKGALCATRTLPWANSRKAGSADSIDGASETIALVMPVSTAMKAGIASCGLTRVWNSPSTSPPRTFTAPISVIIEPPAADPPVVSRSTTQNVVSRSARPSSSKLRCASHREDAAWTVLVMSSTVGVAADISGPTRSGRGARSADYCGPVIPGETQRWRCGGCGNLTRFDVTRTRRTTEFWHFDLAGEHRVEEVEVQDESVEAVRCRWCGRADAIEVVERRAEPSPGEGTAPA